MNIVLDDVQKLAADSDTTTLEYASKKFCRVIQSRFKELPDRIEKVAITWK